MKEKKHYFGHRDRLRKRFNKLGGEAMQDYEIIELLLTYVIPQREVKSIAKELLNKFGSIKGIIEAEPSELISVNYIKDKFITLLKLLKEINIIYQKQKAEEIPIIKSIDNIANFCIEKIGFEKEEKFLTIYLDSGFRIITDRNFPSKEFYFSGTVDKAVVYPRNIIEEAIRKKAYAIIVTHNHPNGNITPSEYDKNFTKALELAAKSVGLVLYDHLIVTSGKYFSFKKERLL